MTAQAQPASNTQNQLPDLSQPLTLERAIQIGIENQPSLAIARSQLESSRARITRAESSYFPQVVPSVRYTNSKTAGTPSFTTDQTVSSISLRQLIFDTGRREENVKLSRANSRASEYAILDTRQTIILNVTTAYYEVLRRKELVRVQQASVERARTTLEETKARAEVGTGAKKDIFQAQADYDNALVQLIQAQNDVRLAETTLKNAMGLFTPVSVVIADFQPERPSSEPDKRTAADYVKLALEKRPDLKEREAIIQASQHNVRLATIDAGVTLEADFTAGYRFDPNPGDDRTLTATLSYPLFDAGATRAQVRDAKSSLEQTRKQLELTKQTIQQDVEQAFLFREEARLRLGAAEVAVRAARENYTAATEGLKEGAGTIIDVITAQAQLVTAETNAVQAIYDFYIADARLRRAIGDNDPYLAGGKKP